MNIAIASSDSVLLALSQMLQSADGTGYDELLDSLNACYDADMQLAKGADALGRASAHKALELLDESEYSERVKVLLLTALTKRAIKLGVLHVN